MTNAAKANGRASLWVRSITGCACLLYGASSVSAPICYKASAANSVGGQPGSKELPAVCTALADNLNDFCDQPPMVCTLRISKRVSQLSLPQWTTLELQKNMGLIEKLVRGKGPTGSKGFTKEESDALWNDFKSKIKTYGNSGRASFEWASVDLLNRGAPEKIYQVDTGYCDAMNFGDGRHSPQWKRGWDLLNVPEGHRFAKTDPSLFFSRHANIVDDLALLRQAAAGVEVFDGALAIPTPMSVFLYDGHAYLFEWRAGLRGPTVSQIQTTVGKETSVEKSARTSICTLELTDTTK